jgi:hypothetical protein
VAAGEEQLDVEFHFKGTRALRSMYWIGLEKSGNMYYWRGDGKRVNNGNVSDADPYAHFT